MDLVYNNENKLFKTLLVFSIIGWIAVIGGTFGMALIYVLMFGIFYLFAQSALISYLKGTAVEITPEQFPDLYEKIEACCNKLKMEKIPEAYLVHGDGIFNAFATRFLGRNFIALYSDVVDALENHPDAVNFYIGHELGHIHRKHLIWSPILMPGSFLPLLGTAYYRACEYTCDRYGLACCQSPTDAKYGIAALAAGSRRWQTMNIDQYIAQEKDSSGFWMSFHELTGDYPWLVKRMSAIHNLDSNTNTRHPKRHTFAWLLAAFTPRFGVGGAGSILITIFLIGMLAATGVPAYQQYIMKATAASAWELSTPHRDAVTQYVIDNQAWPNSNEAVGIGSDTGGNAKIKSILVNEQGLITVDFISGESLHIDPLVENDNLYWVCRSDSIPQAAFPEECQ